MKKEPAKPELQHRNKAVINRGRSKVTTELPNHNFGNSNKLLFNLEESGVVLGLSSWTVRDFVKGGKIKAARVPHPFQQGKFLERPILIHIDELERFAQECNGGVER